jgi:hypothetical protein
VLQAIEDKAKTVSVGDLVKVFEKVQGEIYTSIRPEDITELIKLIANYKIVGEGGFPEMRTAGNFGSNGSMVVPVSLEANVVWLHDFLFGEPGYQVSERVREYSAAIHAKTAPYLE